MRIANKRSAFLWLQERVGREVMTRQWRPDGMVWEPGARTVERKDAGTFLLDDSTVRFGPNHIVLDVTDDLLRVEWVDADGTTIHVTTYSDVIEPDDDEEEFDDADDDETEA